APMNLFMRMSLTTHSFLSSFHSHLCFVISSFQMQFMLLFSRQGKLRLQKWYVPLSDKEKKKITRELVQTVLARKPKMCSFLEWRDLKIVYKRYASLYFCCATEGQDNELITLEIIHRYVELLDKYFGSVCELDIIFNFEKAYFILDEFLLGGEAQETSKKNVLKAIEQADLLQEVRGLTILIGCARELFGGFTP
uniref:AP-1 complex subunit sigma-2 n=1 Tax=Nothobranchius furzeri TaxID=105023 RepID=A0A8C6P5J3_NOTFU